MRLPSGSRMVMVRDPKWSAGSVSTVTPALRSLVYSASTSDTRKLMWVDARRVAGK